MIYFIFEFVPEFIHWSLLWKDFSCFRRLILSHSWKSNDRGGLKFWTCLHATVLLAVKYSAELKRLGIFASPLNRYFSQVTLTNRIYLYKTLYPIIDEKNKWRKDFGTMHVMRLYLIVSSSLVKQILAVSLNNWLWTYNWYRVAVENRHPLLKQVPTDNRLWFIAGTRWQQNAIPVAKACTHC